MESYWDKSKLEFNIILPKRLTYQTNVHTDKKKKTSNICLSILGILYIVFFLVSLCGILLFIPYQDYCPRERESNK